MINKIIEKSKDKCTGCCACLSICPKDAISMNEDNEGFKYPVVDENKCINCGLCVKICPTINKQIKNNNDIKAYACINKDTDIRLKSSSGGIFSVVADYILSNNGIVFGAAFDKAWNVEHIYIEYIDDLDKLRTSKYVQSYVGINYKYVKEFLDADKLVLFTGTPCQIAGLKAYLGKDYGNLYCMDIICHGVPSPKVWRKYLKENYNIDNIEIINFRDKTNGWNSFLSFKIQILDKVIIENRKNNLYMLGFLNNLYLRPSCYNCNFKTVERVSDITIADFWGIDEILPEMNDGKGTSLIFVQNNKGYILLEKIKNYINMVEADVEKSVHFNTAMIESVSKHRFRDKFFNELNTENKPINSLIEKYYLNKGLRKRLSYKLRKFIKDILRKG